MPLLVRIVRPYRWYREPAQSLLAVGDVPADSLADLNSTDATLSVYELDEDRNDLKMVLAAFGCTRGRADDVGYLVFDSDILPNLGISLKETLGNTPDSEANKRHRDLADLTGNKIVGLARELLTKGEDPETFLKAEVISTLKEGVAGGRIPKERVPEKIRTLL
jgi:hypothetical protein